jgi:hypothetical protein
LLYGKNHAILSGLTNIRITVRQTACEADLQGLLRAAGGEEQTHQHGPEAPSFHFP